MRRTLLHIILVFACSWLPLCVSAQDAVSVTIRGKVTLHNKVDGEDINERVEYAVLTKAEAIEAKAAFDRLTGDKDGNDVNHNLNIEDQVRNLKKKYGFVRKNRTKSSGRFEIDAATTLCLLFITNMESRVSDIVEIVDGKTEYNVVINVVRTLKDLKIIGNNKTTPPPTGDTGDPESDSCYFEIVIPVAKGEAKESTRLIIQTYAVNCQTDDTVAYCKPLVFEGLRYHDLQDKRMNYAYFTYDSLRNAYQEDTPLSDEEFTIRASVAFKKENKNTFYRGPYTFAFEDYHHVYKKGGWSGTCQIKRPFKLLDFSPALADLELTEEFKEEAQSQFGQENRDLQLRFVLGKDVLEDDSMNTVNLKKLVDELRSYGNKLVAPKIQGMASPDGGMKANEALALRRAQKAASMIQPYLPSGVRVNSSSSVYTWTDVADAMAKKGKTEEANQVREIAGRMEVPDRELRQLPFYETDVVPVLESMRAMRASYQYIRAKVLTSDEAVTEYLTNKPLYQSGKKNFSNGDYWNIFNTLTDSVEIDTLVSIAYRHIVKDPEYANENIIAPYICNKVALMNLKKGISNPRILEPFIDLSRRQINARKPVDEMVTVVVNRKEILLNQAVTYYLDQKMDSARMFVNWLRDVKGEDPALDILEKYMNLKRFHFVKNRNAEQEKLYLEAKDFVLNASDENKAILYTEIPDWGMTKEAMKYVDRLPDSSPKKWYLKALLWVDKAGSEKYGDLESSVDNDASDKIDIGGGFYLLSVEQEDDLMDKDRERYDNYLRQRKKYAEEHNNVLPEIVSKPKVEKVKNPDDDVEIEKIPYYMAFFHHAFELEPLYKRMYFNEGRVPDDTRKKYKYKKINIPAYKKLFRLLKQYEDLHQGESLDNEFQEKDED